MALEWKLHHFKHQIVYLLGSGFHHVRLQHLGGGDHDDKDFLMVLVTQVSPAVLHCKGPSQLRSCRVAGNACLWKECWLSKQLHCCHEYGGVETQV